jgi:hypothetical protein
MEYLARRLGIDVARERLEQLAPCASFDQMKAAADRTAPNADQTFWKSTTDFFHKGTTGQWRDVVGADELPRYDRQIAELTTPEFAQWLHHGSLG